MNTRSQAKSVQLTELVTPPNAESHGGLINFRQALAGVKGLGENEGSFCSIC